MPSTRRAIQELYHWLLPVAKRQLGGSIHPSPINQEESPVKLKGLLNIAFTDSLPSQNFLRLNCLTAIQLLVL